MPTPIDPTKPRNPDWNRDELILALEAYLRWQGNPPKKTSTAITELSEVFGRLQLALGGQGQTSFRNTNGVYMKLMNFRRFDPAFTSLGKSGLSRGNHLEEEVWRDFAGQPDRLGRVAAAIRVSLATDGAKGAVSLLSDENDLEAMEGRILTALHHKRERARGLVERKKADALRKNGKLVCEVCAFDYEERYGIRGQGFIECHHTKPVETLGDGAQTRLSDLALLCANCHRMIHARRPWLDVPGLALLVRGATRLDGQIHRQI